MTIFLGSDIYFQMYQRTKLFVIVRVGAKRDPAPGFPVHAHHKHVIARGRVVSGNTLRVTRSEVTLKQIRSWFQAAGHGIKVVGAKRR